MQTDKKTLIQGPGDVSQWLGSSAKKNQKSDPECAKTRYTAARETQTASQEIKPQIHGQTSKGVCKRQFMCENISILIVTSIM